MEFYITCRPRGTDYKKFEKKCNILAVKSVLHYETVRSKTEERSSKDMQNDINVYISSVVEKYSDMIYRTAYHALGDKNYAEDITQEVFLKLMRTLPDFKSDEHEKAWLLRVTLNMCSSHNRKQYSHPEEELFDTTAEYQEKFDEHPVLTAVRELPEKYRTAVYLYYIEGYDTQEIADITGQNRSTVFTLLKRARERLKKILKEEFDYEEN